MFEYLEKLNPEQTEAVTHSGSPLLILAGAGSGKTRVITTKIAYLIQKGLCEPYQILAVTFTKKAANEMKERAIALEANSAQSVIRTFHSFGAWFLRCYAEVAGVEKTFTVYDDDDMATLIVKAVPSLKRKDANFFAKQISLCKDYCLTPDDDLSEISEDPRFVEIYSAYENRLRATGNVDFGDLIMLPVLVLQKEEAIRRQMQHRFRVIMVDEYQDSNVAQFKFLQLLSGIEENSGTYVCVVGDDDQSIYKFRGAEVQNILQFPKIFSNTQIIRLEKNYRSTSKILAVADAVVRNNQDRLGKTLEAVRMEGSIPKLVFIQNQDEEAVWCANLIEEAVREKKECNYSDFAILYRTNAQSLNFEREFLRRKIPYIVIGSLKFYEREEVKDLLAYISYIANQKDEVAFSRIINKPSRGIGEKSQEKILLGNESELPKKSKDGLKDFRLLIKNLHDYIFEQDDETTNVKLSVFIEKLIEESGLEDYYKAQDKVEGTNKVLNMHELSNNAASYNCSKEGLLEFLDSIELDRTLSENAETVNDAVTFITLHNTKGLEFSRVIITGLEQGIFPRDEKTGIELEEERRLFYVGITRAKDKLFITSCAMRRIYGRTEQMIPSRFLKEAGDTLKILGEAQNKIGFAAVGVNRNEAALTNLSEKKAEVYEKFKKGVILYHDDYGTGQVVSCTIENGEILIIVQFETGAKKKFLPEHQSKSLVVIKD